MPAEYRLADLPGWTDAIESVESRKPDVFDWQLVGRIMLPVRPRLLAQTESARYSFAYDCAWLLETASRLARTPFAVIDGGRPTVLVEIPIGGDS